MSHLKTYCECSWPKEGEVEEGESTTDKDYFYLLHWGLKMEIVNNIGLNYTVAICQNCKTGEVICFLPEQLKILGNEIKE
jgi:hypothetical protein